MADRTSTAHPLTRTQSKDQLASEPAPEMRDDWANELEPEATTGPGQDDASWRAVVDAIPDAALILDLSSVVIHHNARASVLFPSARVGLPVSGISRNPEFLEALEAARNTQSEVIVQIVERVPLERRLSVAAKSLSKDGRRTREPAMLVTFRDLTQQDRLEQMRVDFVANASHELRTPLSLLLGYVETLQGAARNDVVTRERYLRNMHIQAARMTRLVDDLLSLSRVEMRVHLPPTGVVELNDAAAHIAQAMEPLAESAETRITVHRLRVPARIRGDRDEIIQVIQNLVQNAIKYGRLGGRIDIRIVPAPPRAGSTDPRISLKVIDDGPGIAREHLPRLVERFYRANVASSREKGGTGLGLSIVKHIVLRHGGDLKIESDLGVGSKFTVTFDALTLNADQ